MFKCDMCGACYRNIGENAYLVRVEVNNADIHVGDCCCTYGNKRFKIIDIPGGAFCAHGNAALEGQCTTICVLAENDYKLDETSLCQMDKAALDANSVLLKEDSYDEIIEKFRKKLRGSV